jgi:hypothetical protein
MDPGAVDGRPQGGALPPMSRHHTIPQSGARQTIEGGPPTQRDLIQALDTRGRSGGPTSLCGFGLERAWLG